MRKIYLSKLAGREWMQHWAGHWKLLNNSYLGYQYTKLLKQALGGGLRTAILISHKGYSVAYLDLQDYKNFGNYLANKVLYDKKSLNYWTRELKKKTDIILSLIKRLKRKKEVEAKDYKQFLEAFYSYGVPHRVVKVVVDALSQKKLKAYLPKLTAARVYAEPVYAETEKFMEHVAAQIAKKRRYNKDYILCVTKDEFFEYWRTGKYPSKQDLKVRYLANAVVYYQGNYQLFTGSVVTKLERALKGGGKSSATIHGFSAYPGIAKGRVHKVFNPKLVANFKIGDILVTGMTRPEYLPLIRKSAAFITDAGGLLSHAAITARELKKPCVVGARIASKVLREGEIVQVDATNGLIKKITI